MGTDVGEVFARNVWVNPFWEESVLGLVDLIGADRVCFGSDYPHPEGLDDPWPGATSSQGCRRPTSRRSCPPTCST